MKPHEELGSLLVDFFNRVSHPRGLALTFLAEAGLTVDQAILMSYAQQQPGSTPSSLAARMNLSLPSVSQMIERLVKLGMLRRHEDPSDRRSKTITLSATAKRFLTRFREVRVRELVTGTEPLSPATRKALIIALTAALTELEAIELGLIPSSKDTPS